MSRCSGVIEERVLVVPLYEALKFESEGKGNPVVYQAIGVLGEDIYK